MRRFYIADVNAKGELRALAEYRYEQLEQIPGANELIGTLSGAVWRSPQEFETPLHDERSHLILRWRATASTAGGGSLLDPAGLGSLYVSRGGLAHVTDAHPP